MAPGRQPGLAAADGARSRHQLPRRAGARPPRQAAVEGADRRPLAELSGERADHPGRAGARAAVGSARRGAAARAAGGVGSNAWVVDPARSTTGGALLANDPHLRPAGARRVVSRAPRDARARADRGHPAGHSGGRARTQRQHRLGLHQHRRRHPGPVRRTGRSRGSGPVPDAGWLGAVRRARGGHRGRGRARRWRSTCARPGTGRSSPICCRTPRPCSARIMSWRSPGARPPRTIWRSQALLGIDRARDWSGFVAALRDVGAPMQNILYADTSGHIGFIAPGRVPIRKHGDGRWPVPGWTGEYDWTGLDPVRRPAARARPAGRRAVQRQQPHRAAGLPLPADRRLGSAVPGAPARRAARARCVRAGGLRGDAGGSAVAARAGSAADHARGASRAVRRRPPRWPGSRPGTG